MKVKWSDLFKDLKGVLLKHFRPTVDPDPVEVKVLKMIVSVQKQQRELNGIRDGIGESVRLLNDSEILQEFDRLAKMPPAESESVEPVASHEDVMFG